MSGPGTVRWATEADLDAIAPMWHDLYDDQRTQGMLLTVPEDGYDAWAASLAPALGRFACLFVAEGDEPGGPPLGFLAGRVRTTPPWFGGAPVGFVSEVYVSPAGRGRGFGEALVLAATDWFRGQGIARLELQVLAGNAGARGLYLKLGWREELVQMVLVGEETA